MAGGIDWFRWHHGSVTDQKFPLIARKSGASVAEVIAVWACLLEAASMNADLRGHIGDVPDFEAMDCALGLQDGRSQSIFSAMTDRGLLDQSGHVCAWMKRQPKREREDDKSSDRVRAFRERQRQQEPCNATERRETPRGEESREDKELGRATSTAQARAPEISTPTPAGTVCKVMRAAGLASVKPSDPRLHALIAQGATDEEFAATAAEAAQKGKGWAWVLHVVEARRADAAAIALAPKPAEANASAEIERSAAYLAEQEAHRRAAASPENRERARQALAQARSALTGVTQ